MRLSVIAAASLGCWVSLCASDAIGQPGLTPSPSPDGTRGVLTDYRFRLGAAGFATDDQRFIWDGELGGNIDLVDYGIGRVNFLGDYEVVLGDEMHLFDPNQGNYTLDVLGTIRWRRSEIGGLVHHVSRHLSDRRKDFPIDWNMIGVQVLDLRTPGALVVESTVRMLRSVKRSYVDYENELAGSVKVRYAVRPRVSLMGTGAFTLVDVAPGRVNRGTQYGGRLEGGIRLVGGAASVDLFLALERRIDADPVEPGPRSWLLAGFRMINR